MTQTPAGWYPDAEGTVRWWDGSQWTEHTQEPTLPLSAEQQAPQQPQQPSQQPQQWGQPAGQQQWGQVQPTQPMPAQPGGPQQPPPAYGSMPGMPGGPQKRRMSPGMLAGIGGGVVALLVVIGLVVLFTMRDDDTDNASATTSATSEPSETATQTPTQTPTETPTEEPTETPTDEGGSDSAASDAPKDASVSDFCDSFDLEGLEKLGSGGLDDLQRIQSDMLRVGTPSDMPADARRGWEWFATIAGPADAAKMNQDDLTALGFYYGRNCLS